LGQGFKDEYQAHDNDDTALGRNNGNLLCCFGGLDNDDTALGKNNGTL
jgi:hypothetical protein